ncbi:ABC transporter, integral membrane type 1 [Penicillium italicum]|uniref:ABC transporter, integral membrane type 1 n=1 Tax=Penicillium italicum TaxID=40296 RepID=A0A0A2L5C1_PENIT|nr:ABC transporter, integral membrane type 1 [Penicillium italicum]
MLDCSAEEDTFGPIVAPSCLHGFDFTLLFEESILTLGPIGVVCLAASIRIWKLSGVPEKVNRSWLYAIKEVQSPPSSSRLLCFPAFLALTSIAQLSWLFYTGCHMVLLALWCQPATSKTKATVVTTIATVVISLILAYLSHLEHLRSIRPSTVINVFLVFTLLFDLVRLRTLYFMPTTQTVAIFFATSWVIKATILGLEATEKRSLLQKRYENSPIESTSGVLNRAVFWWLNELLWCGSKDILTVGSLPALDNDIRAASNPRSLLERWDKANKYHQNSLLWTFVSHYKWAFLEGVLPRLAYTGFCFAQPFLVERVLNFMTEPEHVNSANYAYGLIGAYAIVYLGIAISYAAYEHKTYRVITMVRGSLVTLIFNKTLRMSTTAISDTAAITLMSTDIERIGSGLREMHELYSNFTEVALALWLLARLLNVATIASTAAVVVCLAAGVPLAVACGKAQGIWLEAVEERVAITSKVLGVMKNIKITGLTETISSSLRNLRSAEIDAAFPFRLYETLGTTLGYASSSLAPVFGFGVYTILARANNTATLTNGLAFSALTLFSLLDQPMNSIVNGSEDLMAVVNCFQRIQKHLMETERVDYRLKHNTRGPQSAQSSSSASLIETDSSAWKKYIKPCAIVRNVSVAWSIDTEPVLKDLNIDIQEFKITMIVGSVGSGKSTFLKMLMGEIPECSGSVSTSFTHAAYCSQSPWITFGTIQENIVGVSPWDRPWYDHVTKLCALQADFQQLPARDQTKVGVRGSRLSGGQQIRVALARALYSKEPVLLLDDALTGLDQETEKIILENLFAEHGSIKLSQQTVIMATNSAHHLLYADNVIALDENGRIIQHGSYSDLISSGGHIRTLSDGVYTVNTSRAPDVVLDDETLRELNLDYQDTDTRRRTGDWTVYRFYFQNIGWPLLSVFFASCVLFILGLSFPQIWLQWWTRANEQHPNENVNYWLGVYAALGLFSLLTTFMGTWILNMIIQPRTARRFHEILLRTTIGATTSFLTSTDIGNTTNRFSQDLELIDAELPPALELTINAALSCAVEGFLVFFGSSYVTAAVIPVCVLVIYYVAKFYVQTSRQMRLLDIEAKAPLFSQFLEALSGLSSIRAYGWTDDYYRRNQHALDASQRPSYLLYCIQRWIGLVLDLIVACIAVIVIAVAISMKGSPSMNLLGIALFNIVNFSGTLQTLVTYWIGLETSIGAVSRIRSYAQQATTEDLDSETEVVSEDWPQRGEIDIAGLSASYDASLEPVLVGINLRINPGEKVALCGRTGSGKSSLVSAILRILELKSGTILIDSTDISKVSRAHVRSRINTIPQQPFFLHGTVRLNVNPEENATDETIVASLQAVNLWSYIQLKGGLDVDMSDDLLSHGQQQLFCLARALCKSSNIIIMDEATSSVDSETDTLMQTVIRSYFKNQTVIAIAHKLHTVLDFDKVAVMENGKIVEFDTPKALLSKEGSAFRTLLNSSHDSSKA